MIDLNTPRNKKLIGLLLLNILLAGFILGFAIAGRVVQSNWESFYDKIEDHCECDWSEYSSCASNTWQLPINFEGIINEP